MIATAIFLLAFVVSLGASQIADAIREFKDDKNDEDDENEQL